MDRYRYVLMRTTDGEEWRGTPFRFTCLADATFAATLCAEEYEREHGSLVYDREYGEWVVHVDSARRVQVNRGHPGYCDSLPFMDSAN